MNDMPDWLGGGAIAALIASCGYVANLIREALMRRAELAARRDASLVALGSQLLAAHALYLAQRAQAERLEAMLRERGVTAEAQGIEALFGSAFASLRPAERELHSIVRAGTVHSVRRLNLSLSAWLAADVTFKLGLHVPRGGEQLAPMLNQLELHLLLWHAKYEAWIPGHPEHALVYMADEAAHGTGFPKGLDALVVQLVNQLRPRTLVAKPGAAA
jgi:hypothetical protein